MIGITPDGKILPCGRFTWDSKNHVLSSLSDIAALPKENYESRVDRFHKREPQNWRNCCECEAKPVCNYGCQAFIVRSVAKLNIECAPTKLKFGYFESIRNDIISLYPYLKVRKDKRLLKKISRLESSMKITDEEKSQIFKFLGHKIILQEELNRSHSLTSQEIKEIKEAVNSAVRNAIGTVIV